MSTTINPGDTLSYVTSDSRKRGVAVSVGGGFVVGTFGLVRTTRTVDGIEIDHVEPYSTTPVVVPVDAVEVVS